MRLFRWLSYAIVVTFSCHGAWAGTKLPSPEPQDMEVIQACLASKTAEQAPGCIGAAAALCLESADSQQRMTQCVSRERSVWDIFLNNDFDVVLATIRPEARAVLTGIQSRFVSDTQQKCTFIRSAWGYSSYIQVIEIEKCWMRATAMHWLWLRDFLPMREKPKPARQN